MDPASVAIWIDHNGTAMTPFAKSVCQQMLWILSNALKVSNLEVLSRSSGEVREA